MARYGYQDPNATPVATPAQDQDPGSAPIPGGTPVAEGTPLPEVPYQASPEASPVASYGGERVDVVIVGCGASGSLLAAKLATAGKAVVILEAGPDLGLKDMVSSQIWSRRWRWNGAETENGGAVGAGFNNGWGGGGSASHHYAVWLRLHEEDFEVRSRFGVGNDWPFAYADLRPYYDRIQEEVGISGDADAEVWRPEGDPYPMGPLVRFGQGKAIARGFEAIGVRTSPIPVAINSVPYKGRNPCVYDGWCDAGCPIGALANPLVTYLPIARAAGTEIRFGCTATRVVTDETGARATAVEYVDGTGNPRVQEAAVVIVAAFAIQTPRLLLLSANDKHPDGLANSSGLVGAYMTAHPTQAVYALFDEETDIAYGVSGGTVLGQDDYAKDPAKGYLASWQWLGGSAVKPNDLIGVAMARVDLLGQALHDFVADASHHMTNMAWLGENRAAAENRITLSETTDALGLPIAKLTHAFHEDDLKALEAGMAQGAEAMTAGGAREVWQSGRATQHIMGGAIMGTDPTASVTDQHGITHDVSNLVISGTPLFPTSGAVNPTFTVHALALRQAEHLIAEWDSIAG